MRDNIDDLFNRFIFNNLDAEFISEPNVDFEASQDNFVITPFAITFIQPFYNGLFFQPFGLDPLTNDSAEMPWLGKIQNIEPDTVFAAAEYVPSDPNFGSQLFLINGNAGQLDINVETAWNDYTGEGVQVNVFDNGFDYTHADLAGNYLSGIDYDYTSGDFDPSPESGDNHGTAVIGIVGAVEGNNEGGVGIAFDASLVGYRGFGLGASGSDQQILDAAGLGDGVGNTNGDGSGSDIISVSAGYSANVFLNFTSLDEGIDALETISAQGRDGLGTIYVKSSGNSRAARDSSNREEGTAERFDSTEFSISVAALRLDGWVTDYSTPGANVLVSAFADNLFNNGTIFTTDRSGNTGYSSTDYTTGFSGTSAAAPQVAAVVALMLEANPELGWRDVQKILAASAVHVGSDIGAAANSGSANNGGFEQATQTDGSTWFWNAAGNWNGGAMHFSNDYGYGVVDATAAVRLAESWQVQSTSANQVSTIEDDFDTTTVITDGDVNGLDFIISETENISIEHVSLELTFSTTYLADVEVYLTSPDGTRVQLIGDTGDSGDFNGTWRFGTTAFMGEESSGDWTLTIVDDAGGDTLTVTDAVLRTSGSTVSTDDTYIFTNEFSEYAGVAGHSVAFIDTDGGTDWINAAAVSSSSTLNLQAGTGTIDGVAITLDEIENIYAGDEDDILTGSSGSNSIFGGQGNDIIIGAGGDDMLDGGAGDDTIIIGAGNSDINGGEGLDRFGVNASVHRIVADLDGQVATLFDAAGNDIGTVTIDAVEGFRGGIGNDLIVAGDENTLLNGLDGDDTLTGGLGNDILYGGSDNDDLSGGLGQDFIFGGSGDDEIFGGDGDDRLRGNSGEDEIYGEDGNDLIVGGSNDDILSGGADDDVIKGGTGEDLIYGGTGNDTLFGNENIDDIRGGSGIDTINGGSGNDRLQGNGGNDIFVFEVGTGSDQIVDFDQAGDDVIDLTDFGFADYTDLESNISQSGNHVIIDLGSGDEIILLNTDIVDVDGTGFIF